jgi:3'(2'), 5'-bisphosphate nucleotidase
MDKISVIRSLVEEASEAIMQIYKKDFDIETKSDDSPLTEADLKANSIITAGLRKQFSGHAILTEEEKDDLSRLESEYVLIIDPLDGTKEFIKKNGEFTLNVALIKDGQPILGVISVPARGDMYWAKKGTGAFHDGHKIEVSSRNQISEMIMARSRSHATEKEIQMQEQFADSIAAGSSLKGCLVADGRADAYYRMGPVNEWDIAAMTIILREAGGKITDLDGKNLAFNKQDTLFTGFLASNGTIHDTLLSICQ